jgi:quercetin dioxygenase-like cupin family protein
VAAIFRINESDVPWFEYEKAIRVKALTRNVAGVPPVQFVEYGPGHTDPMHSHDTDEFFIVTEGELYVDDTANGPGSVVFIPRGTEYAVRAGDAGVRYFRVVV